MEAAHIAGLRVERLINEPTAAALAFGYDHPDSDRQVMIFDIGEVPRCHSPEHL